MKALRNMLLILLILPIAASLASAKDIKMSVNQTEYYFLVGEQGAIDIEFDNPFNIPTEGMITYTVTQETNQGGMQYSSTNTQSQPFTVPQGEETITFNFGSSDSPMKSTVDLSFSYQDTIIELNDLEIHFVQEESQKQNQENKKKSSKKKEPSQQQKENQKRQQEQQQQLQEQMQQMQQQMNQVFQNQQSPQKVAQQDAQDKVQNNQMAQDSSALKQQMQQQLKDQEEMKKAFQENLGNNQDFQEKHKELLEQGYNLKSGNLDPTNQTSGSFELNYEKEGETASLKGAMEDNQLTDIQKTSSEEIKEAIKALEQDPRFQKHNMNLAEQQFTPLKPEVEQDGNTTTIKIPYENKDNQTATITAKIEDNQIKDVKLEHSGKRRWWIWTLLTALLLITSYILYKRYVKKNTENKKDKPNEKPTNFRKEAKKILEKAKLLFKNKKEKDAYGKAAEAIRFYYSHKLDLRTELTNSDLIKLLKKHKIPYEQTQRCLNLCGLVEFAKYNTNKGDFNEIINLAVSIIK